MKVFLSPAKNMRAAAASLPDVTAPRYLRQAEALAAALRPKAPFALERHLQTSPAIALPAAAPSHGWQGGGGSFGDRPRAVLFSRDCLMPQAD